MITALLLAAEQPHSAPVTHWGQRIGWTLLTILVLLGLYWLMLRGWRRRAARHADLPPLPEVPDDLGAVRLESEGVYVVTTTEGDWLDRVVAHGLGARSEAELVVADAGVLLERTGAPAVFVPAAALKGVRLEKGMAGKVVEEGGLVVLTWRHGPRTLDTGFRPRRAADRDALLSAVASILPEEATA